MPEHRQPVLAEGRRKPEIGRLEPPPGSQGNRAFRDILASMAAVGALSDAGRDSHPLVLQDAILLHQDGIETFGHRRAGKDANRFAASGLAAERMAGGGATRHRQYRLALGPQIAMRDGIAIDSAVGMRRHIDHRDEIARKHPPTCLGERRRLLGHHRCDTLADQRERRVDAEQLAAKGEAILAQLRHVARPK